MTEPSRQAIEAMISAAAPARPRALAVLDGVLTGMVLTDGSALPEWALVVETADGTVYGGGEVSADSLRQAVASVKTASGDLIFGFDAPDDPIRQLLPPNPYYTGSAIDFTERRPPADESELLGEKAPEGLRLVELDAELLPRTEWADDTIHAFGSLEAWSERGIGHCLLAGDEVVAQATAGPRTRTLMELGVWTRPSHRRRGLSTLVSLHAAVACEARGGVVWWNTNAENVGSIRTAMRIGFTAERRYDFVAYRTSAWPA
jgi:RimJ/RimL family protein N-acetyltransferase